MRKNETETQKNLLYQFFALLMLWLGLGVLAIALININGLKNKSVTIYYENIYLTFKNNAPFKMKFEIKYFTCLYS